MSAKLVKENDFYYLLQDDKIVADLDGHLLKSITGKLSKLNCDEIFGAVDVIDLAERNSKHSEEDYISGFNKHAELNRDKVFTLEDMHNAMDWMMAQYFEFHEQPTTARRDEYLKSLKQPTEIDVEIEMICPHPEDTYRCGLEFGCDTECHHPNPVPRLDSNGCLILKKAK
jgi:hypothetical protein